MITSPQDGRSMGEPSVPLTRRVFAADVMLRHLDAMAKRVEGVRAADDVEMVHKMRVATRRLRNALDLLGDVLPSGRLAKWMKRIKAVTKALGRARDTDVQAMAVERFIEEERSGVDRAHAIGVERLLLRLRQRRAKLQPAVVKAMDRLESSRVIDDLRQTLLEIKAKARLAAATDVEATPASGIDDDLLAEARTTIQLRLEQMLAYEHYVHDPTNAEELHAMRIAAKYLRYTMEAYGPLFVGGLRDQVELVRRFQDLLGVLHDADVWLDQLPRFAVAERRRHADFFGHERGFKRIEQGVGDFEQNRRRLRDKVYRRFVGEWEQATAQNQWQTLRDSLSSAASPDTMQQTEQEPAEAGDDPAAEPKPRSSTQDN